MVGDQTQHRLGVTRGDLQPTVDKTRIKTIDPYRPSGLSMTVVTPGSSSLAKSSGPSVVRIWGLRSRPVSVSEGFTAHARF